MKGEFNSKGLEDVLRSKALSLIAPLVLKSLPNHKRLRVLDLGCGQGYLCHLIAQQGNEAVGVDVSPSTIEKARTSFPECKFIVANIYELPFDQLENNFDVIISIEVIEHLFFPRELLRAANRCLGPQGRFIISAPYHGYVKNLILSVANKWDQHFNILNDGWHIKFFSPKILSLLLSQEGFTNISFKFIGRIPYAWRSMICYSSLAP